jgi:hypothetical protein
MGNAIIHIEAEKHFFRSLNDPHSFNAGKGHAVRGRTSSEMNHVSHGPLLRSDAPSRPLPGRPLTVSISPSASIHNPVAASRSSKRKLKCQWESKR